MRNAECGMRSGSDGGPAPEPASRIEPGCSIPHSDLRIPNLGGAGMSGRWLAIDTATDIASVAVGTGATVLAGAHAQGARRHAAEILRLVDFVLTRAAARLADLDGIVLGDGPGSFTGLRIGWATAQGPARGEGFEGGARPPPPAPAPGAPGRPGARPTP